MENTIDENLNKAAEDGENALDNLFAKLKEILLVEVPHVASEIWDKVFEKNSDAIAQAASPVSVSTDTPPEKTAEETTSSDTEESTVAADPNGSASESTQESESSSEVSASSESGTTQSENSSETQASSTPHPSTEGSETEQKTEEQPAEETTAATEEVDSKSIPGHIIVDQAFLDAHPDAINAGFKIGDAVIKLEDGTIIEKVDEQPTEETAASSQDTAGDPPVDQAGSASAVQQ